MEEVKKKNKIVTYIYIVVVYILVFQNFLQSQIKLFQYADEIVALIGIIFGCIELVKNKFKIRKDNLIIILSLSIIIIIGFIPIFLFKYQELKYATIDCFLVIKFFAAYLLGYIIFKNYNIMENSKIIEKNVKLITIILFLLTIINYMFDVYIGEQRYGIKSNQLFYDHPTYLVAACITLLVNGIVFSDKNKYNYIYMIMLFITIITTLRAKALAIIVISLAIILYVSKSNKKIGVSKVILMGMVCLIIGYQQISFYFVDLDETARKALTTTSVEIANDYFPLGTGFGTFGSYESGENYSSVYRMYEINEVYGLEEGEAHFISDSFWPMIIGQFGYLGCILYIICIMVIFVRIQKDYNKGNKKIYIAKMICLIYLIIASSSESAFANPIAISLALVIGMQQEGIKKE